MNRFCSRHQTGWDSPPAPALCPVCHDAKESGGKPAHQDPTAQELADNNAMQPDTPRVNYARSCGTSALTIEACKLERELKTAVDGLSESMDLVNNLKGGIVEQTVRADEAEAACERQRELKMDHAARASELRTELEDAEAEARASRVYAELTTRKALKVLDTCAILDCACTLRERESGHRVGCAVPHQREALNGLRAVLRRDGEARTEIQGAIIDEPNLDAMIEQAFPKSESEIGTKREDASCPGSSETGEAARAAEPLPAATGVQGGNRAPALKPEDAGVGSGPVQAAPSREYAVGHQHTFCPHCNPCRHQGAAQDAMLRLASWLGHGPGGGEFTTVEDMEARIRQGVDTVARVEGQRIPSQVSNCEWTFHEAHAYYGTACGHDFSFSDSGSLESHGFTFCYGCGKRIHAQCHPSDGPEA